MKNLNNSINYVAVRKTDDDCREWFDLSSISGSLEISQRKARDLEKRIPLWAKSNPIVRFTTIRIIESKEMEE